MSAPTNQSTLKTLLGLSWPIVLARATQSVIGFCDALFVAPLGEEPLAAAMTGALNTFSMLIFPMGTVFIVQSFVAQLRGRGDHEATPRYALYGLVVAGVAGGLAALAIPFVPTLLGHFDYAPRVHALMSTYLGIRLWSIAAAVGVEALGNWFGGLGNTRPSMIAGVIAMVANVFGCYLLVQPRFGLPGYGVAGAAWASVFASWLAFAVMATLYLRGRRANLRSASDTAFIPRFEIDEFRRMLRFGLPNGLNWFLEFAAFALFINLVIGHLGTTVLAAFNVVMQLNSVSFMPAFGLASGGAILVGEAIGKRAQQDVWPLVRLTGFVSIAWMGSVGLIYAAAPKLLMSWFKPENVPAEALLHTGTTMLTFAAVWQVFDAIGMTVSEALRAAGDTVWCMMARIVLAWFVFTPCAWAAVFLLHGGVATVMLSMILYMVALSSTLAFRFASGHWKRIDLVGGEPISG